MHCGFLGLPLGAGKAKALDPDVAYYLRRCPTPASLPYTDALNTFVIGMKAAGLWAKMMDIGLFIGDLQCSLVKLKFTTPGVCAHTGVVSTDYGQLGLAFGTGKGLNTGVSIPTLAQYNWHLSLWRSVPGVVSFTSGIGSSYAATGDTNRFYLCGSNTAGERTTADLGWGSYYASAVAGMGGRGLATFGVNANSASGLTAFMNGVNFLTTSSAGRDGRQTGTIEININASGAVGNPCYGAYTIGLGLTQADNWAFWGLMNQFQTGLGR